MRTILAILLASVTAAVSQTSTNQHIRFLSGAAVGEHPFAAELIKEWVTADEDAAVPETADFHKLEHIQLFVAANPTRYEPYVSYGRHLATVSLKEMKAPTEEEYDGAIYAFERAIEIIEESKIRDPVDFDEYFAGVLLQKYCVDSPRGNAEAVKLFDRMMEICPRFLEEHLKSIGGDALLLAILNHNTLGHDARVQELILFAERLKGMSREQRAQLSLFKKKYGKTQHHPGP